MKLLKKSASLLLVFSLALSAFLSLEPANPAMANAAPDSTPPFSWDNATVYFAMTDRFMDGDPSNNHSYGRELDANGDPYPNYKSKVGTFHGGDLKGLTQKIEEGYFNELGVNAIWITAPYEQIHGWVGGENFRHYAYHGYYALDYTEMDRNMGTKEEMRAFVDTAHEHGIRVVMDVVLNHAGYETMKDMDEFDFGELAGGWQNYYYNQPESAAHYDTYADYIASSDANRWARWWGPDWIRSSYAGYSGCGSSDLTLCLSGLPDFKTESSQTVGIPPFLAEKWGSAKLAAENAKLDAFFARTGKPRTVSNHLISWLTDWVREYGIDGFRVDTAKHVEMHVWKALKEEAVIALRDWKAAHPDKKLDDLDFWMTGEAWGHGLGRSAYFDNGFDSMINFSFQGSAGNLANLEGIYSNYAASINSDDSFNMLSYISSHDTSLFNRSNLINAGTSLLMLPGGVQIFYGDETARPPVTAPWDQPTRSDMNWSTIDAGVLSHWQKLGQFRSKHIAVGAGSHKQLQSSPYAFSRTYNSGGVEDKVAVVVGASGSTTVNVGSAFEDGTTVTDFYTGQSAVVTGGQVTFAAHANGVILIEEPPTLEARVSASPAGGSFSTETKEVTLYVRNAETGVYTLDGSDPKDGGIPFENGQTIAIGAGMEIGDSVALRLYAVNDLAEHARQYVFTKTERSILTVHFKKPANWGTPHLYYYETSPEVPEPVWTTSPAMVSEGNGWYAYSIEDAESARVIFKDNNGNQIPGRQQPGLVLTAEGWYDNGWIADPTDSVAPSIPSNVSASAATGSSITLIWDASTDNIGVAGYEIYRDGAKVGDAAGTTYTDSGLSALTEYSYTVKAYDAAGNVSEASAAVAAATAAAPPTNQATVYYKRGYATPYFHYMPAGGAWTAVPGLAMEPSPNYAGYSVITVDIGTATSLKAAFNNGSGVWDNNGGQNYTFQQGVWTFDGGSIVSGAPDPNSQSLTISLSVPANTSVSDSVYIAGSFNGWNPADGDYRMTRNGDGTYFITFDVAAGTTIQYKFTRGTWASVEANANGSDIANRTYTKAAGAQGLSLSVPRWKDK